MHVGVALLGVAVALCAHSVRVLGEFRGLLPPPSQENLGLLDILRAFLMHWGGGGRVKTRLENGATVSVME